MLNNTKNYKNESCIDFEEIDTLLKKYVRVKTYLSMKPIFGKILESTESTITVVPEYIESFEDINYDKLITYLLPKSSLIEVKEIL